MALDNASSIYPIVGAMEQRTRETALTVFGDLNSNITDPERNSRDKSISVALSDVGLEVRFGHFLLRRTPWA